jgi:hypothetical protein
MFKCIISYLKRKLLTDNRKSGDNKPTNNPYVLDQIKNGNDNNSNKEAHTYSKLKWFLKYINLTMFLLTISSFIFLILYNAG